MTLYAEDFSEGDEFTLGSHTFSDEEIVSFAEQFDPQSFHVDEDAAAESMFGGLTASGWHVAAVTNRLATDALYSRTALSGGRGMDDLRFYRPTRPGDTLTGTVSVDAITDPPNRSDHRDIDFLATVRNQSGEDVFSMVSLAMVARRESE